MPPTYGALSGSLPTHTMAESSDMRAAESSSPPPAAQSSSQNTPTHTPSKFRRTVNLGVGYAPGASLNIRRDRKRHVSSAVASGVGEESRERMQSWRTVEGFLEEARLAERNDERKASGMGLPDTRTAHINRLISQSSPYATSHLDRPYHSFPSSANSTNEHSVRSSPGIFGRISPAPGNPRVATPRATIFTSFGGLIGEHLRTAQTLRPEHPELTRKDQTDGQDVFGIANFTPTPDRIDQNVLSSSPPSFLPDMSILAARHSERHAKKPSTEPGSSGWETLIKDTGLRTPDAGERGFSPFRLPLEQDDDVDIIINPDVRVENGATNPPPKTWWSALSSKIALPSPLTQRSIAKCCVAYFIASLFTFVPALSALLSTDSETDVHGHTTRKPAYSAHMVATVMVYFHPARSMGSMVLATKFCIILAASAAVVSLISIGTEGLFDKVFHPDSLGSEVGDWVVCFLWIGGAVGSLAWLKQWVDNPSFNTGCSMAAVTLFTVVIKEGGVHKLLEVLLIVAIGASISNLVCFLLWPESATSKLESGFTSCLDSFDTLLNLLTATFLLDRPPSDTTYEILARAVDAHTSAFTKLKAHLADAKHERAFDSRISGVQAQRSDAIVHSLTRLAQHLTGLRGGTTLQSELIEANRQHSDSESGEVCESSTEAGDSGMTAVGDLFLDFREIIGPELRSLTNACSDGLRAVRQEFKKSHFGSKETINSSALELAREELSQRLQAFVNASKTSIHALQDILDAKRMVSVENAIEVEVDGRPATDPGQETRLDQNDGPREAIFVLYFFLFTVEEFAREECILLDSMVDLSGRAYRPSGIRSLARFNPFSLSQNSKDSSHQHQPRRGLTKIIPIDPSKLQPPIFPAKLKNASGTATTPANSSLSGQAKYLQLLWRFQARTREPDIKYAIKVGLGTAMLAAPAYFDRTRPLFLEYRGEWALIACFASLSKTVGATNLSTYRVAGTILGASVAIAIYSLFPENPIVLPIFGAIFAIPCFWIITQRPALQQAGRFILLTYNLTCLYAYNQRDRDLSVVTIGVRRSTSVIVGVVWAGIISNYWWPYAARTELRVQLSDFFLDLSYMFSRIVQSKKPQHLPNVNDHLSPPLSNCEREPLLSGDRASEVDVKDYLAMELHLQIQLIEMKGLLAQTKNEPRLKGPFPYSLYDGILQSSQTILDKLHSMRCVTTRDEWDTSVQRTYMDPMKMERKEMIGNMMLYLYLLAAALRLRTPMPPVLPPAETSRMRLVDAFRRSEEATGKAARDGTRHLLVFTYSLAMQGIIEELEYVGQTLQDAFGVISTGLPGDWEDIS